MKEDLSSLRIDLGVFCFKPPRLGLENPSFLAFLIGTHFQINCPRFSTAHNIIFI